MDLKIGEQLDILRGCSHGGTGPAFEPTLEGSHGGISDLISDMELWFLPLFILLDCRFCKPDLLPINPTFYFNIQLSATYLLVPLKYKL